MKPTHAITVLLAATIASSSLAQTTPSTAKPSTPAAPAVRGTPPPVTDAGCILIANIFATQVTNADQKALAQNVLFFYFGRLEGRTSEAQMKSELRQARATQLTNDTAGALMNNCAQAMQTRAKTFEAVMQQLGTAK